MMKWRLTVFFLFNIEEDNFIGMQLLQFCLKNVHAKEGSPFQGGACDRAARRTVLAKLQTAIAIFDRLLSQINRLEIDGLIKQSPEDVAHLNRDIF